MKKLTMLKWGVAVFFTLALFSGCQTAEGLGRDVEDAGEAIQQEAR